ncbi:MAG: squalene/phytoene synthase family protein, partial [Gammaproteobacteria bacterium]|nr:squalene/phytoene synthase family protein [Gammaproteobacteria bacterium]
TSGMMQDLEYFEKNEHVTALKTAHDLDRYTYLVAGCVGEFWTEICVQHMPALKHWDRSSQIELGIKFGKALQLTNILRDIPKDHAIKRCYIPEELLLIASSNPDKILARLNDDEIDLLVTIVKNTIEYYQSAIDYTLGIPSSQYRLRLACSLPILIGLKTLKLFHQTLTNQRQVSAVKISRSDVYKILLKTVLLARWNGTLQWQLKNAIPII